MAADPLRHPVMLFGLELVPAAPVELCVPVVPAVPMEPCDELLGLVCALVAVDPVLLED